MSALDRKLLRDFRRLWAQALAIAMVLACGVAILLTSFGMYGALEDTRAAYYDRNRFADVFASANRAPLSLMGPVRAIPGVRVAEPRVGDTVVIDVPGRVETATGRILSLPGDATQGLNLPVLRQGRLPDPTATDEIAVNAPFAEANRLLPGDTISANLGGRKRVLTITGTLLSPEFIYTIGPGALMPDNEGYGILWMPERAVAAAFDMAGAFNDLALKLDPGADETAVIEALDALLKPYGGLGAHGRDLQQSDSFVDAEIRQLRITAMILPPIFFAISAFLVNMVIGRIVALERSEIGLLKAIGYSDVEVCVHYLLLAGLIAVVGTLIGWGFGSWLSGALARLYAQFFDFPFLVYRVAYDAYAISALLAVATAGLGAAQSAMRAARLPPAVAMAPPAPPRFKRTLADRAMTALRLSQPVMMILRSLLRWPLRSGLTALGLALAVAILVSSSFFDGALRKIVDTAFYQANRQDAMLLFAGDMPETALPLVRALPAVLAAEGQQYHAVRLSHGPRSKRVAVEGHGSGADMARIIGDGDRVVEPPRDGILLSTRLASHLRAGPGDEIELEFLGGRNETFQVPVAGTVTQYFGLGAYMHMDTLNAMLRQGPRMSVANLTLDDAQVNDLHAVLKDTPNLAGLVMMNESRRAFEDTIQQNVGIMTTIYISIAVLITFGVAYNSARIQLSERARELASLRILGFSRGEVSFILMGEAMLLAVLAQPLGWLLGTGISALLAEGSSSDLYSIPLVLKPAGFAQASLVVLTAAFGSALIVRRRLDRLDLVAVMKTRE